MYGFQAEVPHSWLHLQRFCQNPYLQQILAFVIRQLTLDSRTGGFAKQLRFQPEFPVNLLP
jgi:hypothetical protein